MVPIRLTNEHKYYFSRESSGVRVKVKHVPRGHLNKCPFMTGVPSSHIYISMLKYNLVHRKRNLDVPTGVHSSKYYRKDCTHQIILKTKLNFDY